GARGAAGRAAPAGQPTADRPLRGVAGPAGPLARAPYDRDRQLNRALHTIVLARLRDDPQTRAYPARRRGEGKSIREVRRCLKRAVARQLFKLLERYSRVGVEVMYVR
ncbi:MAG TPA: hypothetical protein VF468_00170, partial [Actinomycetota bacterium]|nr:hypothetical protein [Actinomycetota bacterium]